MARVAHEVSVVDTIWRGATNNGRVLVALIFRCAAQKFGSGPVSYLWTLVEPAIFIGLLILMRIYARSYVPAFGDSGILFLMTGILTFRMVRSIINTSGRAIVRNRSLFGLGQVKPPDVVIAATIVEYTIWLLILVVFFTGVSRVLTEKVITDFQGFVLAQVAILYLCLAISLFNATFGAILPVWNTIWKLLSLPMMLTSGVIYVPSQMPPTFQAIIAWNPLLHCVEGVRQSSYLDYISLYDPYYLTTFSTVVLLLALSIERLFRRDIIRARTRDDEEDEYF